MSDSEVKSEYLMGQGDGLSRQQLGENQQTFVSQRLHTSLLVAGMKEACEFYANFFGIDIASLDYAKLGSEFQGHFRDACSLGLFQRGGIGEQDYLNLWALARVFAPKVYIESGVFIGSSLHAFIGAPHLEKIIGIDPFLTNLKIDTAALENCDLIDDKDFSEVELESNQLNTLAYFDDHIDTADRVLQASDKGLRFLLFDDSTGVQGICQRLYPAIPTIPMIMNHELWNSGDEMSWTYKESAGENATRSIASFFGRPARPKYTRVTLKMTDTLLDKCRSARSKISKVCRIPDLGDYVPQLYPDRMFDTTKFIVELKS